MSGAWLTTGDDWKDTRCQQRQFPSDVGWRSMCQVVDVSVSLCEENNHGFVKFDSACPNMTYLLCTRDISGYPLALLATEPQLGCRQPTCALCSHRWKTAIAVGTAIEKCNKFYLCVAGLVAT